MSDENTPVMFESLPPEYQQKVLALKRAHKHESVEETMGLIHLIVMSKRFNEQEGEARRGCDEQKK